MVARPETPDTGEAWLAELEDHRRPLTGYCYRMLGSAFEADDAVQETRSRPERPAPGRGTELFAVFGLPPRLDP